MNAARKNIELDDPEMSLGQAARELKTSKYLVLQSAVRGELEARVVAGRTVVSRRSVAQLKQKRARAEAALV